MVVVDQLELQLSLMVRKEVTSNMNWHCKVVITDAIYPLIGKYYEIHSGLQVEGT